LIHKVHGVLGVEDKGSVVFNHVDNARIDIYISLNETTQQVINHELSHQFIQYCGIPNDRHLMVEPILSYPLEELQRFLDENGLDASIDCPDIPMNDPQTHAEVDVDEEEDEVVEISRDSFVARRTPYSSRATAPPEPDLEVPRPRSLLGDGAPGSNESSMSAARAEALLSTATTPVMAPSRERMNDANPALGSNNDASIASSLGVSGERHPAQQESNHARQLLSAVTENERRIGSLGETFVSQPPFPIPP
jgi:hypothetical protein